MAQTLSSPQRYRGFVLTATGLQKLRQRIKQLETQTRLRQSPRSIAERVQLSEPDGIHSITVRKILDGKNGVDKRSLQLVFQVLQLQLEEGDCAHAGLCQLPAAILEATVEATVAAPPRHQDWSEALNGSSFYGRASELTQLKQAVSEHCRLVQILGIAGIGKTALVTAFAKTVQAEFEIVIWKSLHHAPAVQTVLTSILQILIQHTGKSVELPTQVEALTELLIEQFQNHRCLIVFDHFDSILSGKQYAGYCRPGYEAYRELLQVIAEVPHQSCVLITSREKPRALGIAEERQIRSLQLNGLSASECQQFSNHRELIGSTDDWRLLIQQYDGNPLILKMIAVYIQSYFDGRISDYLKYLKLGKLLFSDLRDLFNQQFDRLSTLEQELVYRLALYHKPISVSQFREDITSSISHQYLLEGLDSLGQRSLLRRQGVYFSLDPIMKVYVNECLIEQRDHSSSKRKLEIVPHNHPAALC